ncbi:MAG: ion transporter [Phycisphaerales bacterium]
MTTDPGATQGTNAAGHGGVHAGGGPAGGPPDEQAAGVSDGRPDGRPDGQFGGQSDGQSAKRSDERPDEWADEWADGQSDKRPAERSDKRPAERSVERPDGQSDGQSDAIFSRPIAIFIQCLIVVSLVAYSIETLPDLPVAAVRGLRALEIFVVTIFSLEYAIRVWRSPNRWRFIFSFYGIIDLLAILPFYLSLGLSLSLDLRSLRAFRLLRLVRILKLARYSIAMDRFRRAFALVREELVLFGCIAAIVMFIAAVGIYHFEHQAQPEVFRSVFDGLWWAAATLTTVGYGDVYPVTGGGRFFTVVVLLLGLGIVAVPTGLVATALGQVRAADQAEARASAGAAGDASAVGDAGEPGGASDAGDASAAGDAAAPEHARSPAPAEAAHSN